MAHRFLVVDLPAESNGAALIARIGLNGATAKLVTPEHAS